MMRNNLCNTYLFLFSFGLFLAASMSPYTILSTNIFRRHYEWYRDDEIELHFVVLYCSIILSFTPYEMHAHTCTLMEQWINGCI